MTKYIVVGKHVCYGEKERPIAVATSEEAAQLIATALNQAQEEDESFVESWNEED